MKTIDVRNIFFLLVRKYVLIVDVLIVDKTIKTDPFISVCIVRIHNNIFISCYQN